MKNKRLLTFLPLVLVSFLMFGACGKKQPEPEPTPVGPVTPAKSIYDVNFYVGDEIVYSTKVEEGSLAFYSGDIPTKEPDGNALKYRFRGWDRSITEPITENTDFHAVFSEYVREIMIDDFESYECSGDMIDKGWHSLGYNNGQWTQATKAAVTLGYNSVEGEQALRFDAWENGVGYKFAKSFEPNEIVKSANAFKFRMMAPSINTFKILFHLSSVKVEDQYYSPAFHYEIKLQSSEYVEYIIPFDDPNWALWGEAEKSIASVSEWTGIHQDDVLNYLVRIEFYLQGPVVDGGAGYAAFLDSARFVTLDDEDLHYSEVEQEGIYKTYTATTASNNVLRLDIDSEGNATARINELEEPVQVDGKVTYDENNLIFKSNDDGATLTYSGKLIDSGKSIKQLGISGSLKNYFGDMDFTAVQVLDNFEQYEEDGVAYYQDNPVKENRSGARGAYYAEYYTGGKVSTEWGGGGWSLLGGDGDQLKLVKDPLTAHSGNNYLSLKNSETAGIRYMQWGLFDGSSDKNAFRGTKLSFWAKTDGYVPSFKVSAYSQSAPRNATKDLRVKSKEFKQEDPINKWTHFEIELNPNAVYYGFLVFMEKNNLANSFLLIDDVEICGANPYAELISKELVPSYSYIGKLNGLVRTQLDILSDSEIRLSGPSFDTPVDGTYAIRGSTMTMTLGDTVCKTTISDDLRSLTFKSIEGNDDVAAILNNLNYKRIEYVENAETYESDGQGYCVENQITTNLKGARGAYYYEKSSDDSLWELTSSGSEIKLFDNGGADGNKYLRLRRVKTTTWRYIQWDLHTGKAEEKTGFDKFVIHFKNDASGASVATVEVSVFKVKTVTGDSFNDEDRVTKTFSIPVGSIWNEYSIPLDPEETYYGYAITLPKEASNYLFMDLAYFSSEETNPMVNFYGIEDLVLTSGNNSIEFGRFNKASFTCPDADLDNADCTYAMSMNGDDQEMTLVIDESKITGTYSVSNTGKVTFVVTSVEGALASSITVGSEFESE